MYDLGDQPPPEPPFDLATLGLAPERLIPDGLYFDMPEETYHGAFGLSYSGMKDMRVSPYLWWAKSPLNPSQALVLEELAGASEAKILGQAFDARIICGKPYFDARYAVELTHSDHPKSLRTVEDIRGRLRELDLKTGGNKPDLIIRLLDADPTSQIWDVIEESYIASHEGKTFLSADWMAKIEMAAALIEKHPELSKALQGGVPQVSVFWTCEKTGIPLRARFDYLKQKLIVDLKTLLPRDDMPLEAAIGREIGFRKYHIQASMYREAAAQIPRLVREGKVFGTAPDGLLDKLVKHPKKAWAWIFSLKGPAPQAFGYMLPEQSMLWSVAEVEIDNAKHLFRSMLDKFGADPWLDTTGFKNLDDANIPAWSLS